MLSILLLSVSAHEIAAKASSFRGRLLEVRSANVTAEDASVLQCRLAVITGTYPTATHEVNTTTDLGCIPVVNGQETSRMLTVATEDRHRITEASFREVADGNFRVAIRGATVNEYGVINLASDAIIDHLEEDTQSSGVEQWHRQTSATMGTKSLYVVRVSTPDSRHSKSLSQLISGMFSTSSTSFQSQYRACSFGKLTWRSAGGMDVTLDNRVSAYTSPSQLAEAAIRKVEARIGRSISSLADKIVFCQPPGTSGWIAVATVNGWRVNVSSGYCLSLSTLMHEVGHTLGLLHSGTSYDCGSTCLYDGLMSEHELTVVCSPLISRGIGRVRRRNGIHGLRVRVHHVTQEVLQRVQELVRAAPRAFWNRPAH
jgi:Gametolysin peptidase M11